MTRAYLVNAYRAVHDPDKVAAYAPLAGPAVAAQGGRFLARGPAVAAFESGVGERTVLVGFDSVDAAVATHDSPAYQEALEALGDGAERDVRVVEAIEGTTATPGAAHFLSLYRAARDPERIAAYRELAVPALEAAGGRFVARGTPAAVFEAGLHDRVVIIEFASADAAVAAYRSPDYRKALDALGDGADRDIRVVAPVG